MSKEGLTEKMALRKDLKEMTEGVIPVLGGKAQQTEGKVSTHALDRSMLHSARA